MSKPTLEIMQDLIDMMQHEVKRNDMYHESTC